MRIKIFPVGPLQVNCSILVCEESGQAVVIDPGEDGELILQELERQQAALKIVVNTHGHFDHIGANAALIDATGAELMIHSADLPVLQQAATHAQIYGLNFVPSPEPTRLLEEGDRVEAGTIGLAVLHVPGHSPGAICLVADRDVFVGDCLFASSIGRTDLPGGNHDQLISGIREKLLVLPDDMVVHPGHGPDTTIGREKKHNPFF
ncbi:MAG: MBL fold metallo-hydrolase [Desulfuromonas sp.]|nr:MAG: MBL fold metallo-hydrolase [Desulfuromonas sp.]